jgi:hypothetical protein
MTAAIAITTIVLIFVVWFWRVRNSTEKGREIMPVAVPEERVITRPADVAITPPPHLSRRVRYLRLERVTKIHDNNINVAQLMACLGDRKTPYSSRRLSMAFPPQCLPVVTGLVSPPQVSSQPTANDWTRLNDGSPITYAHTGDAPNAYMQLDLGAQGMDVDRVRVVNRRDPHGQWANGMLERERLVAERLNGVTLTVLGVTGSIVFQYTFSGIGRKSPRVFDFDVNGDRIVDRTEVRKVRYLQLQRTLGPMDPIHVCQLEAHRESRKTTPLPNAQGYGFYQHRTAVSGTVTPLKPNPDNSGWQNMNDTSPFTVAETDAGNHPSLELDLGSEQDVDTVRVVNWTQTPVHLKRLNSVTLNVSDGNHNVVFFHTFEGIDETSPAVFNFNMKGDVIASPRVRFLRLEQTVGRRDYVTVAQLEAHHGDRKTMSLQTGGKRVVWFAHYGPWMERCNP